MSKTQKAAGRESSQEQEASDGVDSQGKSDGSKIMVKSRKSIHLLRKIFHALAGILMAGSYEWVFTTQKEATFFYACFFTFIASGEMMRLYFLDTALAKFVFRFMSILARNYELKQASGMVFFVAGVLSVIVMFPKRVAILAILFLSFGDPCASACGIKLGYLGPKFRNGKSLIGTLGGFFACAATTLLYYYRAETGVSWLLLLVTMLGGIAGAIPETLCGRIHNGEGGPIDVDDNLAVPIGSGLIFYLLLHVFGLHSFL